MTETETVEPMVALPFVDSRVWNGTLTLTAPAPATAKDFSCQVTNVVITGDYDDDGGPVSTLCGETHAAPRISKGYHLTGTFVQDFDSQTGLWAFTYANELKSCSFTFKPNNITPALTVSGIVTVELADVGGDMRTRNTSDFDWMMDAKPTVVWA